MAARIPKRRHPAASLAGNEAPLLLRLVYRIVPKHVANTILPPNASLTRQVWAPEVFFLSQCMRQQPVFRQRCLHTRIVALHACAKKNILNSSARKNKQAHSDPYIWNTRTRKRTPHIHAQTHARARVHTHTHAQK